MVFRMMSRIAVVICATCQSMGVGTILMDRLEGYIKETIASGWAVSLELISTKEAVLFYQKKGFEERPCEWDELRMLKMVCSE